jgi:predicted RNA-binding Zn ribbon-like protein
LTVTVPGPPRTNCAARSGCATLSGASPRTRQAGDDRPAAASAIADLDEAVTVLNEHAAKLPPPAIAASPSGLRRAKEAPASAVTTGLAGIAQQAVALLADRGDQLRACHAPGCVLYFVKSHPRREWCSVACGNRARAARHYDKIREGRAGPRPR